MPLSPKLTITAPGATILWCFKTTGTCTPATSYAGAININPAATETVCANATISGVTSTTACVSYLNGGAAPISFSLASGAYAFPQTLTLTTTAAGGAGIQYCIGVSCTPTTTYSAAITISSAETICAQSFLAGYGNSAPVCNAYTAASSPTATPVFTLANGTVPTNNSTVTVTLPTTVALSDSTGGAVISWCYPGTTQSGPLNCTPGTTYVSSIFVNPPSGWITYCANAIAGGSTISSTICFTATSGSAPTGLATGDTRTVTEPKFPAVCQQLFANKYIASTNTLNIDPYNQTISTPGKLGGTGGTSLEPSLTLSYSLGSGGTTAETPDTTAIQNAINSCSSGQAVELSRGSSGQSAFVSQPLKTKAGVTLLLDPGVTVYATRTPSDWNDTGSFCGFIPTTSNAPKGQGTSCGSHAWLTSGTSASNAGVMGYGAIDGRAWDRFTDASTCGSFSFCGWNFNRVYTLATTHGTTNWQGITVPSGANLGLAYGPDMFHLSAANSFTAYRFTMQNCTQFCLYWGDTSNGLTVWGLKIRSASEVSNTDGVDPSYNSQNVTIAHSFIWTGDNPISVKSNTSGEGGSYQTGPTQNISVLDLQTGGGDGVTIGYDTSGGVSNVLFNGLTQNGNPNESQSVGFGINSSPSKGGNVDLVTFENVCTNNETKAMMQFASTADASTGKYPPKYTRISVLNYHGLNGAGIPGAYGGKGTGNSGVYTLQGFSQSASGSNPAANNPIAITFSGVVLDGSISGSTGNKLLTATLGPSPINSQFQTVALSSPSISVTPKVTQPAYPTTCTATTWKPLLGELLMKTATANNLQSYSTTLTSASFTLQAVLQPAGPVSTFDSSPLIAPSVVSFYDSLNGAPATFVGSATIGAGSTAGSNMTLAELPMTVSVGGTHTYSATYSDANYPNLYTWGALPVMIGASMPTPAPATQIGAFLVGP